MAQRAIVWDVATGREVYTVSGRDDGFGSFEAVAFSPDGRYLAVGGTSTFDQGPLRGFVPNYQIILCDARTGKLIRTLEGGGRSLSFSPDGRFLAGIDNRSEHTTAKSLPFSTTNGNALSARVLNT